jgi:hypothetical protein
MSAEFRRRTDRERHPARRDPIPRATGDSETGFGRFSCTAQTKSRFVTLPNLNRIEPTIIATASLGTLLNTRILKNDRQSALATNSRNTLSV